MLKGKTSRLDERRIRLLNGIGFSWQLQRGGRKRHLQEIKRPAEETADSKPSAQPARVSEKSNETLPVPHDNSLATAVADQASARVHQANAAQASDGSRAGSDPPQGVGGPSVASLFQPEGDVESIVRQRLLQEIIANQTRLAQGALGQLMAVPQVTSELAFALQTATGNSAPMSTGPSTALMLDGLVQNQNLAAILNGSAHGVGLQPSLSSLIPSSTGLQAPIVLPSQPSTNVAATVAATQAYPAAASALLNLINSGHIGAGSSAGGPDYVSLDENRKRLRMTAAAGATTASERPRPQVSQLQALIELSRLRGNGSL